MIYKVKAKQNCKVEAKQNCKGLRFRANQNYFYHNGTFQETKTFKLLKRQSCRGCQECGGTWDFIQEIANEIDELPLAHNERFDEFTDYGLAITGDGEEFYFYKLGSRKYK